MELILAPSFQREDNNSMVVSAINYSLYVPFWILDLTVGYTVLYTEKEWVTYIHFFPPNKYRLSEEEESILSFFLSNTMNKEKKEEKKRERRIMIILIIFNSIELHLTCTVEILYTNFVKGYKILLALFCNSFRLNRILFLIILHLTWLYL